jgi:hypothetical protein
VVTASTTDDTRRAGQTSLVDRELEPVKGSGSALCALLFGSGCSTNPHRDVLMSAAVLVGLLDCAAMRLS